jgi:uncharacterized protein YyaL (SSP411 family)
MATSPVEVAIVGNDRDARTGALLLEAHRPFLPGRVMTGMSGTTAAPFPTPLLEGRRAIGDAPTAFVCEHFSCRTPTTDPTELAAQLKSLPTLPR